MTVRVADFIAQTLVDHGLTDVFIVTGGAAMHLNDGLGNHPGLRCWPCHHEQACAIAAEGYYRSTRRMAAVSVTGGPGGTNAITGVYGAYVDGQALIVVSGQAKWETCVGSTGLPLRQLGDQEVDIVNLVRPVTKYAVMVTDPQSVRYHLERALHLAVQGRPGPVWLDVPINVQGAKIDPATLRGYDPTEDAHRVPPVRQAFDGASRVVESLRRAARPVVLGGSGVWTAGVENSFRTLADRLAVPFVTAFNAHDLLASSHPNLVGRQGTIGDRAGNLAVQNADYLLVLGSRMNIRQIGYNWEGFAPDAYLAMVDIDEAELKKPTLRVADPIHADLANFLPALVASLDGVALPDIQRDYLAWCRERATRYPVVLPSYRQKDAPVNPYVFMDALFAQLGEDDVVVTGDGTACIGSFQAGKTKLGQRFFSNSGSAPMGFDLPAAIGAAVGTRTRRVICLAGDGSIMMNLQELQTIGYQRLPIKVFLLNNDGYHSIKQTQRNYFPGREFGTCPANGVGFPDFALTAAANGIAYARISSHVGMEAAIATSLGTETACLCEVVIDPEQPFSPRVASRQLEDGRMVSGTLDDMAPFLTPEEVASNRAYIRPSSRREG